MQWRSGHNIYCCYWHELMNKIKECLYTWIGTGEIGWMLYGIVRDINARDL